jgi:hypothetical protein
MTNGTSAGSFTRKSAVTWGNPVTKPAFSSAREAENRAPGNRLLAALPDDVVVLLHPDSVKSICRRAPSATVRVIQLIESIFPKPA